MTLTRRSFLTTTLLAATAASLAACGQGGSSNISTLRIASQKGGAKALLQASGALEGVSYQVEWSEFAAAAPLLEALASDAADVGGVGDAPFLFAYASGAPVKAIQAGRAAGGGRSTALIVPGPSPIQTVGDLKGKRVATVRGSIGHYLLLRLLDRDGIAPGDVNTVFLTPGDSKAAFSSGAIDAWATWNPFVGAAVLHDGARIVADGQGLLTSIGFQAASTKAIETKRDLLIDFLKRTRAANEWAQANREAYAQVLSKETGLPVDVALYTTDRQRSVPVPIDESVLAEERDTLAHFVKAGLIATAPDITKAFDPSFNEALGT